MAPHDAGLCAQVCVHYTDAHDVHCSRDRLVCGAPLCCQLPRTGRPGVTGRPAPETRGGLLGRHTLGWFPGSPGLV